MEHWCACDDPDALIVRENLKKKRLQRMDEVWAARQQLLLAAA
ncbi:MAG: hypothetical protein R2844_23810 [Caldilineales bacterium]